MSRRQNVYGTKCAHTAEKQQHRGKSRERCCSSLAGACRCHCTRRFACVAFERFVRASAINFAKRTFAFVRPAVVRTLS
ncbi:hypothetical protein GPALN_004937 [Globodera pallida]|nr:hypothetical protein GPALN_004937 [Globodera pallida]